MKKLTPIELAQRLDPNFQALPHIKLFQKFFAELLAEPEQAKGIIAVSVRHGKSESFSNYFPTWYMCQNPNHNVILTGYSSSFAKEWSAKVMKNIKQIGHLFGVELGDVQRKEHWTLKNGGSFRAVGALGGVSGKGCDLLISDDVIKDQAAANSPIQRQNIHTWYMNDAKSRLTPNGKAIQILSRRHDDDLIGRLLQTETGWRMLRLPAICDSEDDPLGRKIGEALWPQRWPVEKLIKIRDEYELSGQSSGWNCLYQNLPTGDPSSRDWPANYFDNIWENMPNENRRLSVLALDPSLGRSSHKGDYSAFVFLVLMPDGKLYVKSWLVRLPADQLGHLSNKLIGELQPTAFSFEGSFLGGLMPGTSTHLYAPVEDKIVRIRVNLTSLLGSGKLKLDPNCQGNRLLLAQLQQFPTATYDDGPDALTQAVEVMNKLLHGQKPSRGQVLSV